MKFVIDFNAFVDKDKKVIIKELTVVDIDSTSSQHWIFKPPNATSSMDRHNAWIAKHYHGLEFFSGDLDYDTLNSTLEHICTRADLLYAHDRQKARVLNKLIGRLVFDLESLGCPPLPKETLFPDNPGWDTVDATEADSTQCLQHRVYAPGFMCSQSNALYLANWCAANAPLLDMNDPIVRKHTFGSDWKHETPSSKDLAEAGFVRVDGTTDSVKCVYCEIILHMWQPEDDPDADHYKHSPFCKFVRFRMQSKRDKDKKKKKTGCHCEEEDEDDYFHIYQQDITLSDVFSCCRA